MKQNYNDCLNRVLKSEGGYTNDPQDPGGPTNYGITIHDYRSYINKAGTAQDVKKMTVDQAKAIYKSKYWDKVNGDTLPSGVDYTVFDYGVNSGVGRANRIYTKFKTQPAIRCINNVNDERLSFLHGLSTWPRFGKGWGSRVASVRQHSIQLANQPVVAPEHKTAGGVVVAGGAAAGGAAAGAAHYFTWPEILIGTVLVAGLVWLGVYIYRKVMNK